MKELRHINHPSRPLRQPLPRSRQLKICLAWTLLFLSSLHSGIGLSGMLGATAGEDLGFNYSVLGYYKFDEQTLIGIHSGQEGSKIPLLASLYVRLPLGGVVLPVATGDIGAIVYPAVEYYAKVGGGLDWKNGKRTSLLILGGYENLGGVRGIYGKAGLLLEF